MRTCTKCDTPKKENHFYKRKNGLSYMCKDCYTVYRLEHPVKYKESYKKSNLKAKGTLKFKFQKLKSSAKQRGIIMTLTIEQLETLNKNDCYYCQNKLGEKVISGSGLDRLDHSLGYTIDNCVACCRFCNTIKMNLLTPEEMKKVATLLIKERKIT
jgi:hypothetical protein